MSATIGFVKGSCYNCKNYDLEKNYCKARSIWTTPADSCDRFTPK